MILILIALIAVTALAVWCSLGDYLAIISGLIAPIFVFAGLCGLMAYSVLAWTYISAGYQADIINREYKTNYTQAEVFYASSVIDTIRELDRKRVELNGDLITGDK